MGEQKFDECDRTRLVPKLVSHAGERLPEKLLVVHPDIPDIKELLERAARSDLSIHR